MSILENGKPDRPSKNGKPKGYSFDAQRDLLTADLLSPEEKEALRQQAREDFIEARKKEQADQFYRDALAEERRKGDPAQQLVPVFLQLPGSANYIMIDGQQYFTDTVYNEVPIKRAHVLIEQMTRAWAHEEQTEVRDSKGRRRWRPPPGVGFGNHMDNRIPRNMTLSTAEVAGAINQMRGAMLATEGQFSG